MKVGPQAQGVGDNVLVAAGGVGGAHGVHQRIRDGGGVRRGAGVNFDVEFFPVAGEFEVNRVGQNAADAAKHGEQAPQGGLLHHLWEKSGEGDAGDEMGNAFHGVTLLYPFLEFNTR